MAEVQVCWQPHPGPLLPHQADEVLWPPEAASPSADLQGPPRGADMQPPLLSLCPQGEAAAHNTSLGLSSGPPWSPECGLGRAWCPAAVGRSLRLPAHRAHSPLVRFNLRRTASILQGTVAGPVWLYDFMFLQTRPNQQLRLQNHLVPCPSTHLYRPITRQGLFFKKHIILCCRSHGVTQNPRGLICDSPPRA